MYFPIPSPWKCNLLRDIFWRRSGGDKRSRSADTSITVTFLQNNVLSALLPSPRWPSPLNQLPPVCCWAGKERSPCAASALKFSNRTLRHEGRWLLFKPRRGGKAWQPAQTPKLRYRACGGVFLQSVLTAAPAPMTCDHTKSRCTNVHTLDACLRCIYMTCRHESHHILSCDDAFCWMFVTVGDSD